MILNTNSEILSVFLDGVITTNELDIVVSFDEGVSAQPGLIFSTFVSTTNGVTKVTILPAPEQTERRIVDFLSIHNNDTVTAIITLQIEDTVAVTDHVIIKVTLQPGDSLIYKKEEGFKVIDSNGGVKTVDAGAFGAPSQSIDIGDSILEGTSVNHTRADHQHAAPAPPSNYPVQVDIGDARIDGAATTPARSDHGHAAPAPGTGYPQNVVAVKVDGVATTPARSDHVHKLGILTTKGDILTHSTIPVRLPVGTEGQILTVEAAQPQGIIWADPSGIINIAAVDVVVAGTTTETSIFSFTIPANLLGTQNRLKLVIQGRTSGSTGILTVRLKYGATTLATLANLQPASVATEALAIRTYVSGNNSATAQVAELIGLMKNFTKSEVERGSAVEDSTTALLLEITVQPANTSLTYVMEHAVLQIWR